MVGVSAGSPSAVASIVWLCAAKSGISRVTDDSISIAASSTSTASIPASSTASFSAVSPRLKSIPEPLSGGISTWPVSSPTILASAPSWAPRSITSLPSESASVAKSMSRSGASPIPSSNDKSTALVTPSALTPVNISWSPAICCPMITILSHSVSELSPTRDFSCPAASIKASRLPQTK